MICPCGHKLCGCVEPLEPDLPTWQQVFGRGLEWLLGREPYFPEPGTSDLVPDERWREMSGEQQWRYLP